MVEIVLGIINNKIRCHFKTEEMMSMEEVSVPVILVGGKNLEVAEEILKETKIKAISLSRPLIRKPKLIKRWIEGDIKKATCVSCNMCFTTEGRVCILNNR